MTEMTTTLSTHLCTECGGPMDAHEFEPMHRDCFRCDGHNHWVETSGTGGVHITSCIDPSCSFSLVD